MKGKGRFKKIIAENRWLKWVPNSLTLCNSLCGFAAVLYTLRAYEDEPDIRIFATTAWIILFAMVFDAFDGFAARIFNAASMHGIQMDSLSDMVTFGMAPAVTLAIMTHIIRGEMPRVQEISVYALCAVYLGGAALRLATYNVHAILEKKSDDTFSGLPTPGGAAAICSIFLFGSSCRMDLSRVAMILPVYAAILGLLMVSRIRYIHFGKWLFSAGRNPRKLLILSLMLAVVAVFRSAGVLALVNFYVLSGPLSAIWRAFSGKKSAPGGGEECAG